jgi:predicted enzyme related to lactoylglutathione lyase
MVGLVVYAKNAEALANFYARVFTLRATRHDGGSFTLTGHAFELHVVGVPRHIASEITLSLPPVPREATPLKLTVEVPSVDDVTVMARGLGAALHGEPWTWNARRHLDLVDPEGNIFQIFEAVA